MKMMMVILAKLFSNGDSKRNPLQLGRLEWGTRYLKRNAFPRFSSCILTRTSTVRYQSRIIYLSQAKRIPIPGLCTKALDIILYSLSCNCWSCSSSPRCVIIRWSMEMIIIFRLVEGIVLAKQQLCYSTLKHNYYYCHC